MAERWRVILKCVFASGTLEGGCFDTAVANGRDEDGLNMLFDAARKSDAIVLAHLGYSNSWFEGQNFLAYISD